MTKTNQTLSSAIKNLSQKKNIISDEANRAKELLQAQQGDVFKKNLSVIDEFNQSISLLTAIFKQSNFDELAMFISHPGRVLIINFFIGILRGIGFMIGMISVIILFIYLITQTLPPSWQQEILLLIQGFNT